MSVYESVVQIATPYFENTAKTETFLARQCRSHLNCEPSNLKASDLWNLAHWAMISGGMMIGKERAEELGDKIRDLRKTM
ncbi:MAG: hypothetical protein HY868_11370 [Chloroflexi bacterium]|nr:hypothetical protein [Chloroflexota bacterium]